MSRPTQRAADKWDSPRFTGIFWIQVYTALKPSLVPPAAGNASRWAGACQFWGEPVEKWSNI